MTSLALRAWHEDTDRRERRQSVLEREERIIAVFLDTQQSSAKFTDIISEMIDKIYFNVNI